jgi:hypothetical protein
LIPHVSPFHNNISPLSPSLSILFHYTELGKGEKIRREEMKKEEEGGGDNPHAGGCH